MAHSGVLEELLAQGRDIIFVSNIDNTGACVDLRLAKAMANGRADYIMEVTKKTKADIKVLWLGNTFTRLFPFREAR